MKEIDHSLSLLFFTLNAFWFPSKQTGVCCWLLPTNNLIMSMPALYSLEVLFFYESEPKQRRRRRRREKRISTFYIDLTYELGVLSFYFGYLVFFYQPFPFVALKIGMYAHVYVCVCGLPLLLCLIGLVWFACQLLFAFVIAVLFSCWFFFLPSFGESC